MIDRRASDTTVAASARTVFRAACDRLVATWIPIAFHGDPRQTDAEIHARVTGLGMSSTTTTTLTWSVNCI